MLLTVDAGNTQTVVGLYELDGESAVGSPPGGRAAEPLADLHRRRAHLRRGRGAAAGLPRPAATPVLRHRGHRRVLRRPQDHRRAARPRRPLPRLRADRDRARRPHRHPHRLRQPEGGRSRPHRQRHRRLRPLRGPDDRGRLRHGHDLRRGLGQRGVPRRGHRPRHRDLDGRAGGQGRGPAGGGARPAPQRARASPPSSRSSRGPSTASPPRSTACATGSWPSWGSARWSPPVAWPPSSPRSPAGSSTPSRG